MLQNIIIKDGKGKDYPEGLKEHEIPIEARIVAVADVFDALTTRRIYRSEYPADEAIKIMINKEDGHFDPDIFGIFLRYKNLFIDIAKIRLEKNFKNLKSYNKSSRFPWSFFVYLFKSLFK